MQQIICIANGIKSIGKDKNIANGKCDITIKKNSYFSSFFILCFLDN